ncbi:LOW QUALITY PROTEIN: nuclear exosome regulator NRDE2-like [Pecten maximus]|uniref:LOW QUALITY PROTEIN: nuclear exosome regulator NRDE2-like n=1 Tax=Pecten maximus TaxID=6579 RepID=UPI001459046F|nr:LOW QUALITY PROTEIN: nuclear exosome regulator NRDE2-like [Pecten maximus]
MEDSTMSGRSGIVVKPYRRMDVYQSEEKKQPQTLFPVTDTQTDVLEDRVTSGNLDWLKNSSYKPESQEEKQRHDLPAPVSPEVSDVYQEHSPLGHTESKRQKTADVRSDTSREDNDQRDVVVKRHRKKIKKEKHKHKSKKHKRHRSRSRSRSPAPRYSNVTEKQRKLFQNSDKVFIDEIPGLEAEDAYRIDRKSNKNNYIYGSVVDRHVAKFKRHVNVCLAADDHPTVSLREEKDPGSRVKTHNRYYNKENRKLLRSAPQAVLITNKDSLSDGEMRKEFISVSNTKSVSQVQEENQLKVDIRDQLLDRKSLAYIQGSGVILSEPEDNPIQKSYLWQKNADYNKRLRENPKDVELWIEFVNFQDRFLYEDLSDEKSTLVSMNVKKLPKQVVYEKKIMILKKAMEVNSSCVSLKLRYLELCQSHLEATEVNKELESLLFVYPTDIALWRRYLLYNQSHLASFSVTRVCKLYSTCIQKLIGYQEGSVFSRGSTEGLDRDMLDLFVQYCCFLRQAGHMEKAVGCFQALIEFNLFCPPSLESSHHQDKQNVFESFWDSGISRVGENNARGWKYWSEHPEDLPSSAALTLDTDIEQEEQDLLARNDPKWKMWLNMERLRESVHWLPWRPDVSKDETEEDCQDVERLVLFDDISSVLFTLPTWLHFEIVLQFLLFLWVDMSNDFMVSSVRSTDCQCNLDRVSQILNRNLIPECHGISKSPLLKTYVSSLLEQMVTYFDNDLNSYTVLTAVRLRFFKQCIGDNSSCLKQLKKFGKSLLKEPRNRTNLYVWSEYTALLWEVGGALEARPVVEAALSMHSGSGLGVEVDPGTRCGLVRLHRILTEIILKFPSGDLPVCGERIQNEESEKSAEEARWGLQCFVKGKSIKDPRLSENQLICSLTMKKMMTLLEGYVENLKRDVHGNSGKCVLTLQHFCEFTRCCVLYAWLSQKDMLKESIGIADLALSKVHLLLPDNQSSSPDIQQPRCEPQASNCLRVLEELHKIKVRMVVCHMSTLSAPLSCLRSAINAALSDFPSSPHFLWLFTQTELKMNVSGQLDRFFTHRLKEGAQPILLLIAVLSQVQKLRDLEEQMRKDNLCKDGEDVKISETSMIHRIRAYCDVGRDSILVQNCPLLWRLCLHTEMKYGKRERAKGMFYQALQHCPWAKMLYLDGVALFDEENLLSVTDLIMEKELRLQIPLEEVDILLE